MVISPTVNTITIISEVQAIIALPVVSHHLPVTAPGEVHPLGTVLGVVHPLGTAPGVHPHSVGVRPLGTAPGVRPHLVEVRPLVIAHQEINPHWDKF